MSKLRENFQVKGDAATMMTIENTLSLPQRVAKLDTVEAQLPTATEPALELVTDPDDTTAHAVVELPAVDPVAVEPPSGTALALQRAFDLTLALTAAVVFAIPALVIVLVVKLTSRGPVFFVQQRVGRNGELFGVYKFRTMRDGTHNEVLGDEVARQAYRDNDFKLPPDDPRITKIGRLLRKTSLDELPQLGNVIRGQMSVVGVRPLLEEELAMRPDHDQRLYCSMRPGMTGLWQVEGRSTVQKEDRLHLDRRHLENWSVWGDVKIATRTPFALLRVHHAH